HAVARRRTAVSPQNGHDRSALLDGRMQLEDDEVLSQPPHSSQAEEAVLGSVLKRGLAIADILPFLKPHHFYEARHRHIFAAMAASLQLLEPDHVYERGDPLVLAAMGAPLERPAAIAYHASAEELTHHGAYESAGGLASVSTGLKDLDTMTLGLSPGLYLLAA